MFTVSQKGLEEVRLPTGNNKYSDIQEVQWKKIYKNVNGRLPRLADKSHGQCSGVLWKGRYMTRPFN